ncbi:hypothetical protein GCM10009085_50110 [Pseudomonas avellanae]|nr:hypothetical protein GCM10009085_50110 [Pseudomonas avellanae]
MSQEDAERPERHADAERRTIVTIIVAHGSGVGMQFSTLCVAKCWHLSRRHQTA